MWLVRHTLVSVHAFLKWKTSLCGRAFSDRIDCFLKDSQSLYYYHTCKTIIENSMQRTRLSIVKSMTAPYEEQMIPS